MSDQPKKLLRDARIAIASLRKDALGWGYTEQGEPYPLRDELLHNIDESLNEEQSNPNAEGGRMEPQREVTEDATEPEAVVIKMTPEQATFVQEGARERGISFEDYARNLFDKGLHIERQRLIIKRATLNLK